MVEKEKEVKSSETVSPHPYVGVEQFLQTASQMYPITAMQERGFVVKMKQQGMSLARDYKDFVPYLLEYIGRGKEGKNK